METAIGKGGCVSLFKKCSRDLLFYADLGVSRQGGSNGIKISHVRCNGLQTTHFALSWLPLTPHIPGRIYPRSWRKGCFACMVLASNLPSQFSPRTIRALSPHKSPES